MLGELALESVNDPARGLALAAHVAGAADEEAEGFHGGFFHGWATLAKASFVSSSRTCSSYPRDGS